MAEFAPPTSYRPPVIGRQYAASTNHYLATAAAVRILEQGGNAIDAGVAAGICINVLQPDLTNIGGVAPIILYSARDQAVHTISGLGHWPAAVTLDYFVTSCGGEFPRGVKSCVLPAAVDSWLTALREFGTMSLAEVAAPAITLADDGFIVYPFLHGNLDAVADRMAKWPSTSEVYMPNGRVPAIGELFVQRDLANMLRMLVEAEEGARHQGREAAITVARDRFYKGDIAERTAAFIQEEGGFLTLDDLRSFNVDIETPVGARYRGYDVYACRPWCQGPVVPETMAILEGYSLADMGQGSADAYHLILEALKAAFADREHYCGDPKFVDVPVDGLLDPGYAKTWRERISLQRAAPGMPEPGNPWEFEGSGDASRRRGWVEPAATTAPLPPDTSYLCVIDRDGNAFSATPSDVIGATPIVPGLGFLVSGRGPQAWLDPDHPSSVAPGKRPRLTPNPGMLMKNGRVIATYGTPGLDVQPQAMVQFLVNVIDFGMDPQAAIEAPRVATSSFPHSSFPHPYFPGQIQAEGRISREVLAELSRRGHQVEEWPDWMPRAGSLCAVVVNPDNDSLTGAADPRRVGYAMAW